ncbi:hypothetical protein [Mycoplasmopsis opalescens]|uniref:hypothetical protein n=1 Tax=Mycoplasmopsis opalescens TaxID=114886 RepID=UPI0004A6AF2D|nr:hypothetical protein [Mycoplasmopsis opalescens]
MKKLLLNSSLLAFSAMPLAVVACNKEKEKPTPQPETPKDKYEGGFKEVNITDQKLTKVENYKIEIVHEKKGEELLNLLKSNAYNGQTQVSFDRVGKQFTIKQESTYVPVFKITNESLGEWQFVDGDKPVRYSKSKGQHQANSFIPTVFDDVKKTVTIKVKLFSFKNKQISDVTLTFVIDLTK